MHSNLQSFIAELRRKNELAEIAAEVDPRLELAEIHRRVIEENGPALLFTNVKGSSFPVVTNLFGTPERVESAFGLKGPKFIEKLAASIPELMPPTLSSLWQHRSLFTTALRTGLKKRPCKDSQWETQRPVNLEDLPVISSWPEDGGPFFTLPLVYTEHPATGVHNLGIYRLQRYSKDETGLHMQIGKGGGFHLSEAKRMGEKLPVHVFLGGPPAAILSAIAPLPENVPELILGSLLLGGKIELQQKPGLKLPLLGGAEFVLSGYCHPNEMKPEGPFGDHYGYYSLTHDFPVFHCEHVFAKPGAVYPATVVGKPRQEDYYIGNYLQKMLSPLFPLVMPGVRDLWSYGETGFHSLSAAVVHERYQREAMMSAFRILGEGQLSLTKFLLLTDSPMDLTDFRAVLSHILARADFRRDLYVISHLSMDTLDYTGPKLNHGSKAVLLGLGDAVRELPREFQGELPGGLEKATVFCPGCLVVSGSDFENASELAARIASHRSLESWPLVVLVDDADAAAASEQAFLWTTFTRFEPAQDIVGRESTLSRHHNELTPPIVIDARMKPGYPGTVETDEKTKKLVDSRWNEYFRR